MGDMHSALRTIRSLAIGKANRLQRAHALQLRAADDELILPARLVYREFSARLHEHPVANLHAALLPHAGARKHHARELRIRILEREILVPARLLPVIRHLALHPHLDKRQTHASSACPATFKAGDDPVVHGGRLTRSPGLRPTARPR